MLINPDVKALADAINRLAEAAGSADELARLIEAAHAGESLGTLRRAILYAVTDPERRDNQNITKLHDAAMLLLNEHIARKAANPDPDDARS